MPYEVFISYSTRDITAAEAVRFALEAQKIRCWIAPRDIPPGKEWPAAIGNALAICKVMILVFSTHANNSPQVTREVGIAFDNGLTVIPFRIENAFPTGSINYYLHNIHWLDALTPEMDKHLEKLAERALANLPERETSEKPDETPPDDKAISFQPVDTTATLMLETVPPGATVYLDKQPQSGKTPLTVSVDLVLEESKVFEVASSLEGYYPQVFQVTLARGKSVSLPLITLQPRPQPQPIPERGRDYEQELTLSALEAERGCVKTVTVENRRQSITIPPGVQEGNSLPFTGLGGVGKNGGPSGDLLLRLKVTKPKLPVAVQGKDVTVDLTLTAHQAQQGGDHTVEVEGHQQTITFRPQIIDGEIETFPVLGGKGRLGGTDGNLIVRIRVLPPEPITGKDVVKTLQLTWEEAQSGCKKTVRVAGQSHKVTIPGGKKDGERVEIPEWGESGRYGGPAGKLILTLKVTPEQKQQQQSAQPHQSTNIQDKDQNFLGEAGKWHPQEATFHKSLGARDDYADVYQFPCCGKFVLGEGAPTQYREDGCQQTPEMDKRMEELAAKSLTNLPEREASEMQDSANQDEQEDQTFHPLNTQATLMLETVPPGATVYLDKQPQSGKTPLTVSVDLVLEESKVFEVASSLEGYYPQVFQVTLARGKSVSLPLITLQPRPQPQPIPERGRDYEQELTLSALEAERGCVKTVTVENRRQSITIPPGVQEGDSLPFTGLGGVGKNGGPPGHLLLRLKVDGPQRATVEQKPPPTSSPNQERQDRDPKPSSGSPRSVVRPEPGKDVIMEVTLTSREAKEGCSRILTVEGRKQQISLPAWVEDGQAIPFPRLGGAGKNGGSSGHLLVRIKVAAPAVNGQMRWADLQLTAEEARLGCKKWLDYGTERILVTVPANSVRGAKVFLSGRGDPGLHGGKPGDLCVILRIEEPPVDGDNIEMTLSFTDVEAQTGCTLEVLVNETIRTLVIPAKSRAGQRLRVRSGGKPGTNGGKTGDLFVTLHVTPAETVAPLVGREENDKNVEAVSRHRKAAEQGEAKAQYELGQMYDDGRGVNSNAGEAARWIRKAAEQGYADAQNYYGWMCSSGRGVTQNHAESFQWFLKAAEQGYAVAQYNLGYVFHTGQGVKQNHAKAVSWYQKAAEQGHATAQCNLAMMYNYGMGVTRDFVEAVRWYRKAAEQGDAIACGSLADMLKNGQGAEININMANHYYQKANEAGNIWSIPRLQKSG